MKFIQAQFSLKYEPQLKIRRFANDIEDCLQQYYGIPQTNTLPDEYDLETPRVMISSKNGHSQISFSPISVDFIANFDNEFMLIQGFDTDEDIRELLFSFKSNLVERPITSSRTESNEKWTLKELLKEIFEENEYMKNYNKQK